MEFSRGCLFYGKLDKLLWLYGPILVMLVVNTFIFMYVVLSIYRTNSGSIEARGKERMDRMLIFIRWLEVYFLFKNANNS